MTIEYDGTAYHGWQRQQDRITIQGELESVLSLILNQEIKIAGSGRTDAGVHAHGQVASFSAKTNLTPQALLRAVNSLLKKQPIVLREVISVAEDFHAQYSAQSKEYHYWILNHKIPSAIDARYIWHVHQPLDIKAMEDCCKIITGVHDFKSFENVGSPRSSTIREIFFASIEEKSRGRLCVKICASGFLKNMVRNLVGSLVAAGKGKLSSAQFKTILEARDRTLADATAPARGLFLHRVNYPD